MVERLRRETALICAALWLLVLAGSGCQTSDHELAMESLRRQVHDWCVKAEPQFMPGTGHIYFPDMDDATMLAAVELARYADRQLYGDLAAVIVRVHREQGLRNPITMLFPTAQDVPRLFAGRFGYYWDFGGDEPLLANVFGWIEEDRDWFNSQLLDEELARTEEVKHLLFRYRE